MKNTVIVILIVGIALGFVVGRASKTGTSTGSPAAVAGAAPTAAAAAAPAANGDVGKTPNDLPANFLKESDLPAGTLAGMTDQQKYSVLKVANEKVCDCGCDKGTVANCRKTDPNCPRSPQMLNQMVSLAREGKGAAAIRAEVDKGGGNKPPPARGSEDPNAVYKVPLGEAPVDGPATAKVTIVEVSDFQCPFCSRVLPTLKQVKETYGQDVRIAMKQNPLSFHPFAHGAAEAALAAQEQGKYWEMYEKMFTNQSNLTRADLEKYAGELGLDMAKFKAALDSQKFKDRIDAEQKSVVALGAGGTPAFFINGRKLSGAQPFEKFKSIIDEEKAKAEKLLASGVSATALYDKLIENGATAPVVLPGAPQADAPAVAAGPKKITFPEYSPLKGPKHAKVTIVTWSDFQCPFCSRVVPTVKKIEEAYAKDVRLIFRHQPLPFHPNAAPAAKAAMAANKQGKFWEMHDKLFENQKDLGPAKYEEWAQSLGLNMSKFKTDMDSPEIADQVKKDSEDGNAVGANGTPMFFINGRELSGAQPYEAFKTMVDEEIKKADELLKSGVKMDQLYEKEIATAMAAAPAAPAANAPPPTPSNIKVERGTSPIMGAKNAPVTIYEFSDFQCPFCSRGMATIKQVEETYKGKVAVVFKQYPLPFHDKAPLAAEAALAAHEQGKFWEMHDKMFGNQQALDRPALEGYASELKLNMTKFKAALDSGKFKEQVKAETAQGSAAGVSGTPSFVVNGKLIVGAQPFDEFKKVIDAELAAAPANAKR